MLVMKNHPLLDKQIAHLRNAIRRQAIEAQAGETTEFQDLDVGYLWTQIPAEPALDGTDGELWARALVLPDDRNEQTIVFYDWRSGADSYHKHAESECLFSASATLVVTIEGVEERLDPGESLRIPARVRHRVRCIGPGLAVAVYEPPIPVVEWPALTSDEGPS